MSNIVIECNIANCPNIDLYSLELCTNIIS